MKNEEVQSFNGGKFVFVVIIIVLLVGLAWTAMGYKKANDKVNLLSTANGQQQLAEKEVNAIVNKVKKHIVLPDETPMVATVADVDSLAKEQAFFVGAHNGDRLLIYSNKAIIYNEETDKLINVGPVFVDGANQPAPTVPEAVELEVVKKDISVDVKNGSKTAGVASTMANNLEGQGYDIGNIDNANSNEYAGNVLVNLNGKNVTELEQFLGVNAVAELPEGEGQTGSDVVVILGN